ncbi:MAG: helix-turn-helix domain-containing protein [Patescibacteria group bacterium]|nr:helix-turn-helix domain-containing protein [Patescibacteria group bacterium]
MSIFCVKKLPSQARLGKRLREAREANGASLSSMASAIRLPVKYLIAIEKNRWNILPKAKVYRVNYLRECAKFLKLNEQEILEAFANEGGFKDTDLVHPIKAFRNSPLYSLSILARNLVTVCFILLFAGYLIWQVKGVLEPPALAVFSPIEGMTTVDLNITVQGETEKECRLAINGQEIMLDENGRFNSNIDLANGLNTIVISATKKHGKTSTITRHIVVKNIGYQSTEVKQISTR